jgi:hypothetical protein
VATPKRSHISRIAHHGTPAEVWGLELPALGRQATPPTPGATDEAVRHYRHALEVTADPLASVA